MKKFLSMFTALVLALSLCTTAFAEEPTYTIQYVEFDYNAYLIDAIKSTLPYEGVNVWMNGDFMTFTDAVPAVVDGRTQAPYRAVLEAMGAEVAYDEGKISATFEDGSVMNLEIGVKVMTYTKGEKVTTVEMDVAPYIDSASGRTFVPVRFIGETLGLTVTWSADLWVAYIVDWDALEAEIDEHFSKMNAMLKASTSTKIDETKTYKTTDSVKATLQIEGLDKTKPATFALAGTTLTKGVNSSGKYTLDFDLGAVGTLLETDVALKGSEIEIIANDVNGIFIKAQILSMLTGGLIPENAYVDFGTPEELLAMLGIDMDEFMAGFTSFEDIDLEEVTIGKVIRLICEDGTMGQMMGFMAPDQVAGFYVAIYDGIFGNDHITVTTAGSRTTYVCKTKGTEMFKGMVEAGLMTQEELAELGDFKFDFEMKIVARDGAASQMTMKMDMLMEGVYMTMDLSGTDVDVKGTMKFGMEEAFELVLDMSSKTATTTEKVLEKPAAGATVLTIEEIIEMYNALLEQLYSTQG